MNELLKHSVFTPTDCLSEQTMFDYIDKKLSAKECHLVEKHLLHCELCSDAMEGLELVKDRSRIATINQKISERIATPIIQKEKTILFNYKIILSIAASILLLIGAVFFFNLFNKQNDTTGIAELKPISAPPPPPPSTGKTTSDIQPPSPSEDGNKEQPSPATAKPIAGKDKEPEAEAKSIAKIMAPDEDKAQATEETVSMAVSGTTATKGITDAMVAKQEQAASNKNDMYRGAGSPVLTEAKDGDDKKAERKASISVNQDVVTLSEISSASAPAAPSSVVKADESKSIDKLAKQPQGINYSAVLANTQSLKEKENGDNASEKNYTEDQPTPVQSRSKPAKESAKKAAISVNDESVADAENAEITAALADSGQKPEFPGGQDSLKKFIHKNYDNAIVNGFLESTNKKIIVQFTIDAKGNLKSPRIVTGINEEADKEMLRVLSIMPKWKPANANGKAISKKVTLPVQLEY